MQCKKNRPRAGFFTSRIIVKFAGIKTRAKKNRPAGRFLECCRITSKQQVPKQLEQQRQQLERLVRLRQQQERLEQQRQRLEQLEQQLEQLLEPLLVLG